MSETNGFHAPEEPDPGAVAVTAGGVTAAYPTPLAAAVAVLRLLPPEQLGACLWVDMLRREKQRRTAGLPGPAGEPGSHVVLSVSGG